MENTNITKINDALRVLNEAARNEKEVIKDLFTSEYDHLKGLFLDTQDKVSRAFGGGNKKAEEVIHEARDYAVHNVKKVDEHVHHNSWKYMGGAAVFGLLLGFILGHHNHK